MYCGKVSCCFLATIVVVLLSSDLALGAGKQLPCNDDTMKHVDRIIGKLNPIGNSEHTFPESLPEAQKYCKEMVKPIATLDDLNKRCIKGMMKEVVGIVLYSVKKKRKSMCKRNGRAELKELVDSGKCVNTGRVEIERCANKSLDRFVAMRSAQNDMKIPLVCCEIARAKKCMLGALDKVPICTDRHRDTLIGHFDSLSGGALKIACSDYQDLEGEKCAKVKNIKLSIKAGQPRPKSLVLPVIQLFESLDRN